MCIRCGSEPSNHTTSSGMRSPKSVLTASTPDVEQRPHLAREPLAGGGVGEVDEAHARDPQSHCHTRPSGRRTRYPARAASREQRRALPDVGVDPHAAAQPALPEAAQHRLGLGERVAVPLEVAPLQRPHPVAIEVEDAQRDVALGHPVDEPAHRRLVVVGEERGRQPQPERPARRQGRPARERGVLAQDLRGRRCRR